MRSKRKDEHVIHALNQEITTNDFDKVTLFHQSLPSIDLEEVSLEKAYFGHTFKYPIYINAMTGGSDKTLEINRKLALIAKQYDLAMSVGSQHVALDDAQYEASFKIVREVNPKGFIIGNVNPNASLAEAKRAIEMIEANALGIHINPAQELTMDEGDRHFKHWLSNIQEIVEGVDVPVIVKEVGNGLSSETVKKLLDIGVKHVDVSGRGGTNFIEIENQRSQGKRYYYLNNWGLSTVDALLDNQQHMDYVEIVASGGIRNPLDVIKALSLGAQAVGMSRYFLELVSESRESELNLFLEDLKKIMVLVDCQRVDELFKIRKRLD